MIHAGLSLLILRKKESFNYKVDLSKNSFDNNWKNNSLDDLVILKNEVRLASYKCQTVANHPDFDPKDTIEDGDFQIRCFVPPRLFHGQIHAIINTYDIDGEWIDHEAMQSTKGGFQTGRWLVHDRFSFKINRDTNYAWSGGCIIHSSVGLTKMNDVFISLGVKPGDILGGKIKTV